MKTSTNDILVVIPARGGSKGIPMKNIKPLYGKPLIQYTIDLALTLFKKEQIFVSTDNIEIQRVAEVCGIPTPTLRPRTLAQDTTSMRSVLLNILNQRKSEGFVYKRLLLLQPTSPFRNRKHIEQSLKLYAEHLDMIVSVKEAKANPYFNLFEEDEFGYLAISKCKDISGRQYAPKVYEYNGAIYLMKISSLRLSKISDFRFVKKLVMSELESLDLDTGLDWDFAEFIMGKEKLDFCKERLQSGHPV